MTTNEATISLNSPWSEQVHPSNLSLGSDGGPAEGGVDVVSHPGFAPSKANPLLWSVSLQEIPNAIPPPPSSVSLPVPDSMFTLLTLKIKLLVTLPGKDGFIQEPQVTIKNTQAMVKPQANQEMKERNSLL